MNYELWTLFLILYSYPNSYSGAHTLDSLWAIGTWPEIVIISISQMIHVTIQILEGLNSMLWQWIPLAASKFFNHFGNLFDWLNRANNIRAKK